MTPLIAATIKGQKDAVKVLLEHGADVSVTCLEVYNFVNHYHLKFLNKLL